MMLSFTVNGQTRQVETDPRTLLLHVLREELGLRGAKYGCGEGECGACTVLLNGQAVNACLTVAGQAHGGDIVTAEAMANDEIGAQVVKAFAEAGGVQCGFCTPGFVLSARALLGRLASPDVTTIQRGLSGNLCRCTGYTKIIEAVAQSARACQPITASGANHRKPPMKSNGTEQFARPATLDEALQLLADGSIKWRILAGGTDVLAQNEHHLGKLNLLDTGALIELREIREGDDSVSIGALASYTDISGSRALQEWAPALVSAAREVGGVQIQNMGTLGGNLVNASPAADGVPPLFVLDARIVLRSVRGERAVAVGEFASGPGRTIIAPDELVTEIVIPKARRDGEEITFFQKVGPRRAQTIAKASVAFRGWLDSGRLTNVRVALGAVAPTVMFAPRTARLLTDGTLNRESLMRAADVAGGECSPIDDVRSTAAYRRKLVRGLLIRNLWQHIR